MTTWHVLDASYPSQAMPTCTLTDLRRVLCTKTSCLAAFVTDPQLSGLLQFPLQTDPRLVGFLHLLLALGSQTLNFLPQVSLCLCRLPQLLLLGHPQEFQLLEEESLDISIAVRYCVSGISTSIINHCKVAFFLLHNLISHWEISVSHGVDVTSMHASGPVSPRLFDSRE